MIAKQCEKNGLHRSGKYFIGDIKRLEPPIAQYLWISKLRERGMSTVGQLVLPVDKFTFFFNGEPPFGEAKVVCNLCSALHAAYAFDGAFKPEEERKMLNFFMRALPCQ